MSALMAVAEAAETASWLTPQFVWGVGGVIVGGVITGWNQRRTWNLQDEARKGERADEQQRERTLRWMRDAREFYADLIAAVSTATRDIRRVLTPITSASPFEAIAVDDLRDAVVALRDAGQSIDEAMVRVECIAPNEFVKSQAFEKTDRFQGGLVLLAAQVSGLGSAAGDPQARHRSVIGAQAALLELAESVRAELVSEVRAHLVDV